MSNEGKRRAGASPTLHDVTRYVATLQSELMLRFLSATWLGAAVAPGPACPDGFALSACYTPQDDGSFPRAQHATQEHLHLGAGIRHALQHGVLENAMPLELKPVVRGQAHGIMAERRRLRRLFQPSNSRRLRVRIRVDFSRRTQAMSENGGSGDLLNGRQKGPVLWHLRLLLSASRCLESLHELLRVFGDRARVLSDAACVCTEVFALTLQGHDRRRLFNAPVAVLSHADSSRNCSTQLRSRSPNAPKIATHIAAPSRVE